MAFRLGCKPSSWVMSGLAQCFLEHGSAEPGTSFAGRIVSLVIVYMPHRAENEPSRGLHSRPAPGQTAAISPCQAAPPSPGACGRASSSPRETTARDISHSPRYRSPHTWRVACGRRLFWHRFFRALSFCEPCDIPFDSNSAEYSSYRHSCAASLILIKRHAAETRLERNGEFASGISLRRLSLLSCGRL